MFTTSNNYLEEQNVGSGQANDPQEQGIFLI